LLRLTNPAGGSIPRHYLSPPMTITITREIEITVEVRVIPGTPATYMQPAEHADVVILDAYDERSGDSLVWLTEAEVDEVREMVLNA